jgi:Uncharacterised nucleotidyltransferase
MGRYQPPAETEQIAATLKRVAAALRGAEIPFALAGSVACWARGGPAPSNDLDFAVPEQDAGRALEALEAAGMRGERPPEGWLLKAYDGDVMVDLIWDLEGLGDVEEVLAHAEELPVESVPMLVMDVEDVFVSRLCAMTEHHLDFANPLAAARALREQVDWDEVRARTQCSPYAIGFLAMLEALAIIPPAPAGSSPPHPRAEQPSHHARVRVVGGA